MSLRDIDTCGTCRCRIYSIFFGYENGKLCNECNSIATIQYVSIFDICGLFTYLDACIYDNLFSPMTLDITDVECIKMFIRNYITKDWIHDKNISIDYIEKLYNVMLNAILNIKDNIIIWGHIFIKLDEFETVMLDQINKISDAYTKKQHLDTYYSLFKKKHIEQYALQKYYKHIGDFWDSFCDNNRLFLMKWFKHHYFFEYDDLSRDYMKSNNEIIDEYVASFETEDNVKIRLDNNYNKYNKIADRYTKIIDHIYEVIDIDLTEGMCQKKIWI